MTTLVDTIILFALSDTKSREHLMLRRYVAQANDSLVIPITVLPEIDYLLTTRWTRFGSSAAVPLYRSIVRGDFALEPVPTEDLIRAIELIETVRRQ